MQMRVGRAVGVGLDATDGFVRPEPRASAATAIQGHRHQPSLADPGSARHGRQPRARSWPLAGAGRGTRLATSDGTDPPGPRGSGGA